jgi:hypothetical protein
MISKQWAAASHFMSDQSQRLRMSCIWNIYVKLFDTFRTFGAVYQPRDTVETPISDHSDHI